MCVCGVVDRLPLSPEVQHHCLGVPHDHVLTDLHKHERYLKHNRITSCTDENGKEKGTHGEQRRIFRMRVKTFQSASGHFAHPGAGEAENSRTAETRVYKV